MKINCSIDGKRHSPNRAKISIFDNSLFYADGLFETLLAVNKKAVYLEEHLDRLEKGARLINLKLPVTRATIRKWINREVQGNTANIKKVRVTLTAGDSKFWAGKPTKPRVVVIVTEYSLPTEPFRLIVSPYPIDEASPFRNVKTLSFIIEMTSRKMAYMSGFDDALLINRSGHVAESTSANIFWIKGSRLHTPPLSAGCLDGMTRRHILTIARDGGMAGIEKNIELNDMLKAEEIFITSSLKLILPVTIIKAQKTHKFNIGPITEQLQRLLRDQIMSEK